MSLKASSSNGLVARSKKSTADKRNHIILVVQNHKTKFAKPYPILATYLLNWSNCNPYLNYVSIYIKLPMSGISNLLSRLQKWYQCLQPLSVFL